MEKSDQPLTFVTGTHTESKIKSFPLVTHKVNGVLSFSPRTSNALVYLTQQFPGVNEYFYLSGIWNFNK